MTLVGADLQYSFFNFDLKGEYIYHSVNRSLAQEDNRGYYFQSTYNFDRAFLTSRYGSFKPDGGEWIGSFSFGAGYAFMEVVELRFETVKAENSDDDQSFLQLAIGF